MRRVQFREASGQQEVEVANGEFRETFRRAEQPFEVEDTVWPLLRRTGEFELVKEEKHGEGAEQGGQQDDGRGDEQ